MKKRTLLSLLGLVAFVAMPIYAQDVEEDVVLDAEGVAEEGVVLNAEPVAEENIVLNTELLDEEDGLVLDDSDEDGVVSLELDGSEDLSDLFDEEELEKVFGSFDEDQKEAVALTGLVGVVAGLGIAGWIICFAFAILVIIAMWKMFEKAGEAGWKAIIPIYNVYIMYKIAGMKNWFWYSILVPFCLGLIAGLLGEESSAYGILMLVASLFSGIVAIVAAYKLPRKFGWGVFASILYVLFTGICILILGFGDSKYEGKSEETVVEA